MPSTAWASVPPLSPGCTRELRSASISPDCGRLPHMLFHMGQLPRGYFKQYSGLSDCAAINQVTAPIRLDLVHSSYPQLASALSLPDAVVCQRVVANKACGAPGHPLGMPGPPQHQMGSGTPFPPCESKRPLKRVRPATRSAPINMKPSSCAELYFAASGNTVQICS